MSGGKKQVDVKRMSFRQLVSDRGERRGGGRAWICIGPRHTGISSPHDDFDFPRTGNHAAAGRPSFAIVEADYLEGAEPAIAAGTRAKQTGPVMSCLAGGRGRGGRRFGLLGEAVDIIHQWPGNERRLGIVLSFYAS